MEVLAEGLAVFPGGIGMEERCAGGGGCRNSARAAAGFGRCDSGIRQRLTQDDGKQHPTRLEILHREPSDRRPSEYAELRPVR